MKVKFSSFAECKHLQEKKTKCIVPYHVYLIDSKTDPVFANGVGGANSLVWMLGGQLAHIG